MADFDIEGKVTVDSKQADKAIDKTKTNAKELGTTFSKMGTKIKSAFKGMGTAAAAGFAAIAAGAATSVKAFAKFDNELRGVKTLLNENSFGAKGLEKGFKDMTDQVKELGRRVPVDLGVMNKALFDTVSAGVAAGEAVKVLEVSAKLATAGLTDISVATDGLTSALNAYTLGAEQSEEVASKFFTAQKFGKTTIEELAGGFGLVGASANAFGVSLDELLAATAAATTAGIKTRAAYTGLKAIFANVAKPTADAAKEAKRLGIEFDSTAIRAKGLKGFLDSLSKSANFNNTSIEKLFGSVEAQNIAFALTGAQGDTFATTLDELTNKQKALNTFTDAYKTSADSVQNQLKISANQFSLLGVAIGEKLAPQVKLITRYWGDLAKEFGGFIKGVGTSSPAAAVAELTKDIGKLEEESKRLAETIEKSASKAYAAWHNIDIDGVKNELTELNDEIVLLTLDRDARLQEIAAEEIAKKASAAEAEAEAERLRLDKLAKIAKAAKDKQDKINITAATKLAKAKDAADKKEITRKKAMLKFDQLIGNQRVQLAGNISGLVTAVLGSENKVAFAIAKGAALAQVAIGRSLALAMVPAQTATIPFPGNLAAAGKMIAAINLNSGIQAATIGAAALQGFEQGGFVGGNTTTGDRQIIRANSNEAVLTTAQQKEFMDIANGGGSSGSEIVLTLKDNLVDFIEAEVIERRSLGEATI